MRVGWRWKLRDECWLGDLFLTRCRMKSASTFLAAKGFLTSAINPPPSLHPPSPPPPSPPPTSISHLTSTSTSHFSSHLPHPTFLIPALILIFPNFIPCCLSCFHALMFSCSQASMLSCSHVLMLHASCSQHYPPSRLGTNTTPMPARPFSTSTLVLVGTPPPDLLPATP